MKKVKFRLLLMLLGIMAFSTLFTACKKEDENMINISKTSIVGKWTLEKTVKNGVPRLPEKGKCPTKKSYIEFLAEGVIKTVDYNEDCKEQVYYQQWELNDDNTLINQWEEKYDGKSDIHVDIYTIKKLTSDEMILVLKKNYTNGKEEMRDKNEDGKQDEFIIYLKRKK